MIRSYLLVYLLTIVSTLSAQINYTSIASGNWNDPSTWAPTPPTGHPNALDGTITINELHDVIIPKELNLTIDETLVNGTLIMATSARVTFEDGPGPDVIVSNTGEFIRGDLSVINEAAGSVISFLSGSKYEHQYMTTEGALMNAIWDSNSSIYITGYTTEAIEFTSTNWSKDLGHVIYNCSMQTSNVSMSGLVNNVKGNFIVNSTGNGALQLSTNENPAINLSGSLEVNGTSRLYFSTIGRTPGSIINIDGDFAFNSSNMLGSYLSETGICTVNIAGNFVMNAPQGLLITSTGNGEGTFNVSGNFSLHTGTLNASKSVNKKQGSINFVGLSNNTHVFFNAVAIEGDMNYKVPIGNTLLISGESFVGGGDGSTFTLDGTLIVESTDPNGAIQTGSGAGNISTNARQYNTGSTIIYRNSSRPQVIGNGQPGTTGASTTSANTNTIIDNAFGVSLNSPATVTIGGDLQVINGDLTVANNNLTVRGNIDLVNGDIFLDSSSPATSAKTLRCEGAINMIGGQVNVISGAVNGDNATLAINGDITGTNYFTFSGANCRVTIGGTEPTVMSRDFPVSTSIMLEQLTINREGLTLIMPHDLTVGNPSNASSGLRLTKGNLKMKGNLTVNVNAILTSGTLFFEDHTVELKRAFTCVEQVAPIPSGMLSSNKNSTLRITGTYSNTTLFNTLLFSPTGNVLSVLELNRSSITPLPHATLNNSLTISDSLYLTAGGFNSLTELKLDSAATIIRTPNSFFYPGSGVPAGGPYHVIYNNGITPAVTSLNTGIEIQGSIYDVASNITDTLNLISNVTSIGALFINAGTWISNDNDVSVDAVINHAILHAPSDSLTLINDLINEGTFNHSNGTVIFNGNSSIIGSKSVVFNYIIIKGVLNSPVQLDLVGDFINNGLFVADDGSIRFIGVSTQHIKGTSITRFNDLTVTNTAVPSVSIETDQDLLGILTLGVNSIFDADGLDGKAIFTLVSRNDILDARVATIPMGASVIGKVNVQRFMSGEGRIYRYLSSPVTNATVADWMDDFPVTGNFKNPSSYPAWPKVICGYPLTPKNTSMYYYEERKPGYAELGYVGYPYENAFSENSMLTVGKGYVPFIRQCIGATIVDVRGEINQGAISIPVTYTNTSDDSLSSIGWNLVGNPYPSAIDWNQDGDLNGNGSDVDVVDGWTKTNIAATIAIQDNGTGMIRYWDGDVDDELNTITNGVIASGQGFWIRTTGASPELIIREGVKTLRSSEFYRKKTFPAVIISLKNTSFEDKAYIKVRDLATNGLDDWDAPKLNNVDFNVSTFSDDKIPMAINAVPQITCGSIFKLSITGLVKGSYTITFSNRGDFDKKMVRLKDKFVNATTTMKWSEPFMFMVSDDVASKAADRFTIEISEQVPGMVIVETPSILCEEGTSQLTISNPERNVVYSAWSTDGHKLSDDYEAGATAFSIPLQFALGYNSFMLKATNGCGLHVVSTPQHVLYENPVIEHVRSDSSCLAGQVNLFATSKELGGVYSWYESRDDTKPVYQGADFKTPWLVDNRSYFVSVTSSASCESERKKVEATIIQYDAPVITAEGSILKNSYNENVQWYFNGIPIADGMGAVIQAEEKGIYSTTTNIHGCEAKAEYQYDYSVTGIENENITFFSYPNPASDLLYITLPIAEKYLESSWVTSFGSYMHLKPEFFEGNHITYNIKNFPPGVYILKLQSTHSTYTFKILKVN